MSNDKDDTPRTVTDVEIVDDTVVLPEPKPLEAHLPSPVPVSALDSDDTDWQRQYQELHAKASDVLDGLQSENDILADRNKRLTTKLARAWKIRADFKSTAANTGAFIAQKLKTPFLFAAYFTTGPVASIAHHAIAPDDFKESHDYSAAWGHGIATAAFAATLAVINTTDGLYHNYVAFDNAVADIVETVDCIDGELDLTAGIRECDPVHMDQIDFWITPPVISGEGVGPYTLYRSLETRVESSTSADGTRGNEICMQFNVAEFNSFETVPGTQSNYIQLDREREVIAEELASNSINPDEYTFYYTADEKTVALDTASGEIYALNVSTVSSKPKITLDNVIATMDDQGTPILDLAVLRGYEAQRWNCEFVPNQPAAPALQ